MNQRELTPCETCHWFGQAHNATPCIRCCHNPVLVHPHATNSHMPFSGRGILPEGSYANVIYAPDTRTPWERFCDRFWPAEPCPEPTLSGNGDVVVTNTTVALSLSTRLRLLISGRLMVTTKTATENIVGKTNTASVAYVLPPK